MVTTKTGILVEALARKQASANSNKVELSADFPAQNAFVNDESRYIVAQCSRRAGKSTGLALRFFKTMEKHPKSQCLYLGMTQDSAREIMWGVLQEMNDKYKLGCSFTESKLEMKHPNGSKLKLMGADLKNFVKRLRGRKYPGVALDEGQDFGSHLQSLVDDVLTPSIADYSDGWLAITGTPGPVPSGYFFDITQNRKFGYSFHEWTLMENPHMPNAPAFLADLKAKREWANDNPTLQREYLNKWVLDVESLWVRYNEKINNYDQIPYGAQYQWNHIMGVDLGYNDADAIAVLAWCENSPVTYLVEEVIKPKQGISALIAQIEATEKKYKVSKIMLDEGGLGKKIAEDLRSRFSCPIQPADKAHKQSNVEFLNDSMRLGKFKAKSDSRFAQDSYKVQIDWDKTTPSRIVIKKKPHSDIIDAVLYAFRESYGYTHKPEPPPKPHWGTKEWAESQSSEMWELELEGHQKEDSFKKWYTGED
jgi:hypothetical protein